AGVNRIGRVGLGDREIGPPMDRGGGGVAVVAGGRVGFVAGDAGRVGDAGVVGGAGGNVDADLDHLVGAAGGHRAEADAVAAGVGAVLGLGRAVDQAVVLSGAGVSDVPGRQRVGHGHTGGVRGAAVVHGQRVGDGAAGVNRIGRVGLGDREIGPPLDRGGGRVAVVAGGRVGLVAGDAGRVGDRGAVGGVGGNVDADLDHLVGAAGGHRAEADAVAAGVGAVLGLGRAVDQAGDLAAAGVSDVAGRQRVGHGHTGGVRGAAVVHGQRVGDGAAGVNRIGRVGLGDREIGPPLDRGGGRVAVVAGGRVGLVAGDAGRVGDRGAVGGVGGNVDADLDHLVGAAGGHRAEADAVAAGVGAVLGLGRAVDQAGDLAAAGVADVAGGQRVGHGHTGGVRGAAVVHGQRVGDGAAGVNRIGRVGLGDREIGPPLDRGGGGVAVVAGGRVGLVAGDAGRVGDRGAVGGAGGNVDADLDHLVGAAGGHRAEADAVAAGGGAVLGPGRAVDQAGDLAAAGVADVAGRQRVGHGHTGGVRGAAVVHGQRVGDGAAGGNRIGRVGLGDREIGPPLDRGGGGVAVVAGGRVGFVAGDAGRVGDA